MKIMIILLLFACFTLNLWVNPAFCLSEDEAKESPCFEIKKLASVDSKWLASNKAYYYPWRSLLDFYRPVQDLLQTEWKVIRPFTVFYDACVHTNLEDDGSFVFRGYGDLKRNLNLKVLSPGYEKFEMFFPYSGLNATCFTSMTDNSTFVFASCCYSDDQMSWGVFSPVTSLPKETVSRIHEHAVSLGFKEEYFSEVRYDSCPGVASRKCDEEKANAQTQITQ